VRKGTENELVFARKKEQIDTNKDQIPVGSGKSPYGCHPERSEGSAFACLQGDTPDASLRSERVTFLDMAEKQH